MISPSFHSIPFSSFVSDISDAVVAAAAFVDDLSSGKEWGGYAGMCVCDALFGVVHIFAGG